MTTDEPAGPARARAARTGAGGAAPAASLLRFVLLIAAVVATAGLVFISVYLLLPAKGERVIQTTDACLAARDADPDYEAAVSAGDVRADQEVRRRFQTCMNPVVLDWAVFVGAGLALLFGAAAVAYLLHPWWIVRRRRLRALTTERHSLLVDDLNRLSQQIGLSRPPDWRLAPYARTAGGQAFGLPWHRYIQVDAGLLVLRVTRPAEFRAVVLHELAHLRNRDVDKTYFAVSIWRAFTVLALLPYLVLMLHPGLFAAPLDWRWDEISFVANPGGATYRLLSLAALTAIVYLTRNAILRVRETHADATAAALDGAALLTVLGRLPVPPAWRRWGTHPQPRRRIDTVRNPELLLSAGFWELVGVGAAAGVVGANLGFLAATVFVVDSALANAVVGLAIGAVAAGLLATAIWRGTAADPAASPSWRTWLGYPGGVVGGCIGGTFLTLLEATAPAAPTTAALSNLSLSSWLVSTAVLALGAVFLAAWATSATRGVLARPDRPHWAMPAIVAVTALIGAVGFAVWLPAARVEAGFADGWGGPPTVGAEIGWYAAVTAVTGAGFGPMIRLVFNPLTLLGLTLLWLVPVLVDLRSRARSIRLRPALIAASAGGAALIVVAVALPYVTRQALPEPVRAATEGLAFITVYDNAILALASVVVAAVMTVVATRRGPHRPVLAVLAACLATVLASVVLTYVSDPLSCYAQVASASSPPDCFDGVTPRRVATRAHWIMLQAMLVAAPVLLIASAIAALARRQPGPPRTETMPSRAAALATVAAVGLLVAALVTMSVLIAPGAYRIWLEHVLG